MSRPPRPSPGELAILRVLWRRGDSTVREVMEVLQEDGPVGYTTVLKQLQIMTSKGLVSRDTSHRTHVYAATLREDETEQSVVADLVDRFFGGSAGQLVMRALSGGVSAEERAEIRAMLDAIEQDEGADP
ncbi:MAG: BlaI/MecI/CopY family transcriptional regulator [Alphaproteobacteria bacterium]|nr:BlaI/MecI/CopY family transcriptional regulator [Alphaproteobacteria bacterium]